MGIFKKPTIFNTRNAGMQGVGEAGAEAILPLKELWNEMDKRFDRQNAMINNTLASGAQQNQQTNTTVVLQMNDIEVGRMVLKGLQAYSNHGGQIDIPM